MSMPKVWLREIEAELSHIRPKFRHPKDDGGDERIWTLDDKLIRLLHRTKIMRCPCKTCLVEVVCKQVCELCNSYNDKCNVIRKHLFNIVECGVMLFWALIFSGGLALLFYMSHTI